MHAGYLIAWGSYRTREIFGGEKFWQVIHVQVKAIGEEKFGESAPVSVHAKYIFGLTVNIGGENFGEKLMIHRIRQFFPHQNFSM